MAPVEGDGAPRGTSGHGVQRVEVREDQAGQRLDNFLVGRAKGVPRQRIYRSIRTGEVRVNGRRARAQQRLAAGDQVRMPPLVMRAGPAPARPHDFGDAVLFESDDLLVINKPGGWAVHGGSGVGFGVIEALRAGRPDLRFLELVHRLDRDTSGCLMIAKRRPALRRLHDALREGGVGKHYLALVAGCWPKRRREVDAPLQRRVLHSGERVVRVSSEGKPSLTRFERLDDWSSAEAPALSLVRAVPVTGRTHQIRVHARHAGHPIVGDAKYGDEAVDRWARAHIGLRRLFLHAGSIVLPDGLRLEAPLPKELEAVLGRLQDAGQGST